MKAAVEAMRNKEMGSYKVFQLNTNNTSAIC